MALAEAPQTNQAEVHKTRMLSVAALLAVLVEFDPYDATPIIETTIDPKGRES